MDLISRKKVKPSGPYDAKILLVGEAPGYEEDETGIPFSGDTGDTLNQLIGACSLSRDSVRITNICCFRPNNNKFDLLLKSPQLEEGVREVKEYIRERKPDWVVILGAKTLEYILGIKGKHNGIEDWRGSVIERDGVKYFCSLHPAAVQYNGLLYPLLHYDWERFSRYLSEGYQFPKHDFLINPEGLDLESAIREIESHEIITCDLEGKKDSTHIFCAGFGLSDSRAICLINRGYNGLDLTFERSIQRILGNPDIHKIFQNGFGYDIEVLHKNGVNVENYSYDTMIGAHVIEPEMSYGLGFLTSIYTDEPYYKSMLKGGDDDDAKSWTEIKDEGLFYDYNCRDCVVTYQIARKQKLQIKAERLQETYDYKHSLIPLSQSLTRSGMEVDLERRAITKEIVMGKWKYYQELLNMIAGFNVNVKSPIHMRKLLLERYKLPERRDPKKKTITFNEDAIVSYLSVIKTKIDDLRTEALKEEWELKLAACKCILLIRGFRQLLSNYVEATFCSDGRLRSVYNLSAATETGRGSSHGYIDGTGLNAQTWPRQVFELTVEEYDKIMVKLNAKAANAN